MTGSRSDSYLGGLFQTSSAGNMARRAKRTKQRLETGRAPPIVFGDGPVRQRREKIRKPDKRLSPVSPKRDDVAELLSEGLDVAQVAERMGITQRAVRRHLDQIRKRLGPQAV